MANYTVTIAREYGSGGREVGRLLSERTGWNFYDKDLITLAAQKSGLSTEALKNVDEKAANSLLYTLALGSSIYNHGVEHVNLPINDRLFVVQSEIIKELGATTIRLLRGLCPLRSAQPRKSLHHRRFRHPRQDHYGASRSLSG